MADINLQEIHDFLVEVAHRAGTMIITANPQDIDQDTKLNCPSKPSKQRDKET